MCMCKRDKERENEKMHAKEGLVWLEFLMLLLEEFLLLLLFFRKTVSEITYIINFSECTVHCSKFYLYS